LPNTKTSTMRSQPDISLRALVPGDAPAWLAYSAPALDRLLGIRAVDRFYQQNQLRDLDPFEFAERGLAALQVTIESRPHDLTHSIPASGPLLVVSNHPYGGIEALALMKVLRTVRTDIKFLANAGLRVFRELQPLFVATNPLKKTTKNITSIRQCEAHLADNGLLVLFPAGRVSSRPRGGHRVLDAPWNRIVGHLALRTGASLLPVFFHGTNSQLFNFMGTLWDRSKMLLLPREFMRMRGRRIRLEIGKPIAASAWRHLDEEGVTRFSRVMTYLLGSAAQAVDGSAIQRLPLAAAGDPVLIEQELQALPAQQRLLDYKEFSVFYASAQQIPLLMADIARERERVFRQHDEGSGNARDGDDFDLSYVQLFVWDNRARSLVGAYRLGRTDRLRQPGARGLYLSRMFEFDDAFFDTRPPSLELGRSFVVPEHQKSFHALYLLWRGIGRYLLLHPQYRRLYGTVSLSRQYDSRAIAVICDTLIQPSPHVRPRRPLQPVLHPEWADFCRDRGKPDLATLSACVRNLDPEGKDLPVLLRHYHRLGAQFLCVAVDPNFNDTPGLLLQVDMEKVPAKVVSTFLEPGAADYFAYSADAPGIGLDGTVAAGGDRRYRSATTTTTDNCRS